MAFESLRQLDLALDFLLLELVLELLLSLLQLVQSDLLLKGTVFEILVLEHQRLDLAVQLLEGVLVLLH